MLLCHTWRCSEDVPWVSPLAVLVLKHTKLPLRPLPGQHVKDKNVPLRTLLSSVLVARNHYQGGQSGSLDQKWILPKKQSELLWAPCLLLLESKAVSLSYTLQKTCEAVTLIVQSDLWQIQFLEGSVSLFVTFKAVSDVLLMLF